jgi:hypothetical protein
MAKPYWLRARGLVLAHQGDHDQALELARHLLASSENSGDTHGLGDAWEHLGATAELAGDDSGVRDAFEQARGFFEEKGCVVCVARMREASRLRASPAAPPGSPSR